MLPWPREKKEADKIAAIRGLMVEVSNDSKAATGIASSAAGKPTKRILKDILKKAQAKS